MKILVPSTVHDEIRVPPGVTVARYDPRVEVPAEHHDTQVLVVWGNSRKNLAGCARDLANLRWVAALSAGVDGVIHAGFAPHVMITSGRGLHDRPVAEHTLMMILAAVRRFDLMHEARCDHRWDLSLGGVQHPGLLTDRTPGDGGLPGLGTIDGANIMIWGFGSIGQTLASYVTMLGARVLPVARSEGDRAGFHTMTPDCMGEVLPVTDILVSVLPATADTLEVANRQIFDALPTHAWFVNVGRGSVVNEDDLVAALHSGSLGGAALDVTDREPLPDSSPLWDAPNLILTPHAAGGRPEGVGEFLSTNIEVFHAGGTPANLVT